MKRARATEQDKAMLVKWRSGMTRDEIGDECRPKVDAVTVYACLKRAIRNENEERKAEQVAQMRKDRARGAPIMDLSLKYGMAPETVIKATQGVKLEVSPFLMNSERGNAAKQEKRKARDALIRRLKGEGMSNAALAESFMLSRNTIERIVKIPGVDMREMRYPNKEIERAPPLSMDAFLKFKRGEPVA